MPDKREPRALPPPKDGATVPVVPERITVYPPYARPELAPEEPVLPLSHYLWILRRRKWEILGFIAVSVISTLIVSARLTPIYESIATIDVDRQVPSAVIGQDAVRTAPNDAEQFLATQIKLIQSDSVLRPVVKSFAIPVTEVATLSPALPSTRVENAPITLKRLKVTRPLNTYLLLISYRSPDPELSAGVANGIAHSYIQHTYDIRFRATAGLSAFMEKQMEELKAKMERSSAALAQFEKDLSVIDPEQKTSILSARLLQLNTEFTNAQGDRVRKQAAFDSVSSGSVEAAQASPQGEPLRRLAERLDEARERFAVVTTQYGGNHPENKKAYSQLVELRRQFEALRSNIAQRVGAEYREAVNRESMLKTAVAGTKAEFDALNARSFQYRALKQEAVSDKGLYDELVRKIKEAGINSSFQNSSIRLADPDRKSVV